MKTALEILNKEAPIFQQDFDTELRDRCVKAMESFAAQSVREYKEKLKEAVLSEINSNTSSHLLSRSTINHLIESTH